MTFTLQAAQIPATGMEIGIPEEWTVFHDGGRLLAVDVASSGFAASLNVTVDSGAASLPADLLGPLSDALVAPTFIDVDVNDDAVDLLFCHLAGGISATALQRYTVTSEGLLVATVTAATSNWGAVANLAEDIVTSLRAAE